jgi:alpha,alpha-trehalase
MSKTKSHGFFLRNDYNYVTKRHTAEFYPSNIMPLWSKSYQGLITDAQLKEFIDQVLGIFSFPGGVPTSLSKTGQQWDYPNAWVSMTLSTASSD